MYNPFGGNKFPYSNFHELNLDWIIEIAKNFLDQYTHIQETIETGLDDLETKKTELEGLLQAWYDEHSQDIADQLADALEDLNDWYTEHSDDIDNELTAAIAAFTSSTANIAATVMESIPSDYTTLTKNAIQSQTSIYTDQNIVDTNYADFDTLPADRIIFFNGVSNAHRPTSGAFTGYVMTVNFNGNTTTYNRNFSIQIAQTCGTGAADNENNTMYYRAKYSQWNDWKKIPSPISIVETDAVIHSPDNVTGTIYADFDTLPSNKIVFYGLATAAAHRPSSRNFCGYVLTINRNGYDASTTNKQFSIQLAQTCGSGGSDSENNTVYFRAKYANWSKWIRVAGLDNGSVDGIRGLKNFTVIGDSISVSLSYPTINNAKTVKSWAKIMADKLGCDCDVYAAGGITTGQMLSSTLYSSAVANANHNQYAIIELGINDVNESVSDATFTQNYQDIVDGLLNSYDFVFCLGICEGLSSGRASKNTIMKSICDSTNKAYYIDVEEFNGLTSQIAHNGHFSGTGYGTYADIVQYVINEVINTNADFINGNYD